MDDNERVDSQPTTMPLVLVTDTGSPSKVAILAWRDRFVTQLDREMNLNFPRLESQLQQCLIADWRLMVPWKAKDRLTKVIQPVLLEWYERTTAPIFKEAGDEVGRLLQVNPVFGQNTFQFVHPVDWSLPSTTVAAGVAVPVVGAASSIGTKYLFISGALLAPKVLIASIVAGTILIAIGSFWLGGTKQRIAKRFANKAMPKLRESLIGGGFELNGVRQESVRVQLQNSIQAVADELLRQTEGG